MTCSVWPGSRRGQALGAGADGLQEEVEPDTIAARARTVGNRERARQVRPAARSAPLVRGKHVELPRPRLRALAVESGDDQITARCLSRNNVAGATAERRQHALRQACLSVAPCYACPIPCSSWSEIGSAPPSRVATIARVAAEAPVSVVMHGIPRFTAAERIS